MEPITLQERTLCDAMNLAAHLALAVNDDIDELGLVTNGHACAVRFLGDVALNVVLALRDEHGQLDRYWLDVQQHHDIPAIYVVADEIASGIDLMMQMGLSPHVGSLVESMLPRLQALATEVNPLVAQATEG